MVLINKPKNISFKSSLKAYCILLSLATLCLSGVLSDASANSASSPAEKTYVVFLNQTTFENFNATTDCYFLEFFEPWCGHCKNLKPIYERSAKLAEEQGVGCKFVAVQASENPRLASEWDVSGYPSIFFVNNKKGEKSEYKNKRNEKDFIDFLISKTKEFLINKISDTVSDEAQFAEALAKIEEEMKQNYLIVLGKEGLVADKFALLKNISDFMISNFEHVHHFAINEQNAALAHKVFNSLLKDNNLNNNFNSESVYVFSRLYNKNSKNFEEFELLEFTESEWAEGELLKKALIFYRYPIFGNATEDLIAFALESGTNSLVIFHDDGQRAIKEAKSPNATEAEKADKTQLEIEKLISAGQFLSEEFKSAVRKLVSEKKLRKEILISHSTLDNPAANILVDVLKFKPDQLPIYLLTKSKEDSEEDLDKYMLNKSLLNKEIVAQFIEDFKQNKLKKFLTSDDLPTEKTDKDGVYKIVGLNFDEFLLNNEQDIALFICSKFSKNCKKFAPILSNVARIFKNNSDLLIGLTDPNYNEYTVDVKPIYPSLIFLPRSQTKLTPEQRFKNSVLFDGEISTKSIKQFILQNTRFKLTQNNIGNETLIHLEETKGENSVKPLLADEGPEAEADFEYENMFNDLAGGNPDFAEMFKNFGGNMGTDGEAGQNGEMPDLSAFKDLFANLGGDSLGGFDMEKIKQMEEMDLDDDILSEEEKMERIKSVMGSKLGQGSADSGVLGDLDNLGDMTHINFDHNDAETPVDDKEESNPSEFDQVGQSDTQETNIEPEKPVVNEDL